MRLFQQRAISPQTLFRTGLDDLYAGRTESGVTVNYANTLTDDAWWAAISLLASDIAGLPWRAYSTDGTLSQPLPRQPTWIDMPEPLDPSVTDVSHKAQVAVSLLLDGNAFIWCEPDIYDPVTLTVLDPTRVRVLKPKRERVFQVMGRAGIYSDESPELATAELGSSQVLHIPLTMMMPNQLRALSPVYGNAGNIGISLAMRKWVETFFGRGGQVSGFVVLPSDASETAVKEVERQVNTRWSGWRKAGIFGVLSGGANWMKTGLSPQDAALPDLWRRALEIPARVYGIPPFLIGSQEPSGVAYASSVDRTQFYIDHCLTRYTRPIEKAYSRLIPGDGRLVVPGSNTEIRFNFDGFLRGDTKSRFETYQTALNSKFKTIDEVRALENLAPMESYSKDHLEGPGGLLQTPNNNPRAVPAGGTEPPLDESEETPGDAPATKPTAPGGSKP